MTCKRYRSRLVELPQFFSDDQTLRDKPEAIDRGRRTQRLEAVQLDAAPLEAAFLQNVARRRVGDARTGDQVLVCRTLRRRNRSRRVRPRCQSLGPNARRRASSRVPAHPARANRCRPCRSACDCFRSETPFRCDHLRSRARTRWRDPVNRDAAGGGYFPRCGDRWRDAQSPLRPQASACAMSAVRSRGRSSGLTQTRGRDVLQHVGLLEGSSRIIARVQTAQAQ